MEELGKALQEILNNSKVDNTALSNIEYIKEEVRNKVCNLYSSGLDVVDIKDSGWLVIEDHGILVREYLYLQEPTFVNNNWSGKGNVLVLKSGTIEKLLGRKINIGEKVYWEINKIK